MPECCRPKSANSATSITTDGAVDRCGPVSTVFGNHQPPAKSSSMGTVTPAKAYTVSASRNGASRRRSVSTANLLRRNQTHTNQGRYRARTLPSSSRLSSLAFHRSP